MKRKTELTEDEVRQLFRAQLRLAGSVAELARRLGCDRSDLTNMLSGKRPPSPRELTGLGLQKRVIYEYAT